MENRIEIYSSKHKAFLLLLGSLAFVVLGIFMFRSNNFFSISGAKNSLFIRIVGFISVLFFSLGIYVAVRQLFKDQLMLIINENGIILNPRKKLNEVLEWHNIENFSEVKISGQKIIIIHINNTNYWVSKEKNYFKRKLMEFNIKRYKAPFNISSGTMKIDYEELIDLLNNGLKMFKNAT